MARSRSLPGRIVRAVALLVFALTISALGLEAVLQVGALVVRSTGRPDPGSWVSSRRRVLALGDSNTYGLRVPPDQSYPAQLERRWNADPARQPIEVLNLGFPGTNASVIRREFPRVLRTFRPDTVLLMVGANDYWTVRSQADGSEGGLARAEEFLWAHSRLYRIVYIARRAASDEPALKVEADPKNALPVGHGTVRFGDERIELGWKERIEEVPPIDEIEREGLEDLQAIVEEARRAGVRLVLVTYPSDRSMYGVANKRLRALAHDAGLPLVDLGARFRAECPDTACVQYLQPDQHPNAAGYARAAELLVEAFQEQGGV